MQNPQDFPVWHKAMDLLIPVYALTNQFPQDGLLGVMNQLRGAAVGVVLNIAEGLSCDSEVDVMRFLDSSLKAARDCVAELEIASHLKLSPPKETEELIAQAEEIAHLLSGLIHQARRNPVPE